MCWACKSTCGVWPPGLLLCPCQAAVGQPVCRWAPAVAWAVLGEGLLRACVASDRAHFPSSRPSLACLRPAGHRRSRTKL